MKGIATSHRTTGDTTGGRPRALDFDVVPTQMHHADGVYEVVRRAHGVPLHRECRSCNPPEVLRQQLERFPEGQFVALACGSDDIDGHTARVVGTATLMRTSRPPSATPLPWLDAIGSPSLGNHDPDGVWLYGVEMAVDPDFQGRGVGSALYRARLALIERLGLKGMYAGGMLKGYHRHAHELTPREYGEKVIRGELRDPTVTMQLNRGFKAYGVIEDYEWDAKAGNCAVLIAWEVGADIRKRSARDGLQPGAPA